MLEAVIGLGESLEVDRVLDRIVATACALTGARYGALGVIGPSGGISSFITHGIPVEAHARIGPLPTGRGLLGQLIADPRPLRLEHLQTHASSYGFPAHHPRMTTFLGVPVRIRGTVFGNLYLTEKAGGVDFDEQDEELVQGLASAAGFVVDNARAYAVSERQRRWLEEVALLTAEVRPEVPLRTALAAVVAGVRRVAQAPGAAVLVASDEGSPTQLVADGPGAQVITELVDGRSGLVSRALGGEELLVPAGDGVSALLVPMRTHLVRDSVLVVLTEESAAPALPPGHDLVRSFADQAALALDRAEGVRDRQEMAILTDRERIARDLHDVVIQRLFAAGLQVQSTLSQGAARDPESTDAVLRRLVAELDTTISDIRSTIFDLQASHAGSLRSEVQGIVRDYGRVLGWTPAVRSSGPVDSLASPTLTEQTAAVVREALSNVARHSGASEAWVELHATADRLEVEIGDDGAGLPSGRRESGLANLRERARRLGGDLELVCPPDGGTRVVWRVPIA
nr:GAF domain-containing protein [Nocardioides perillae]